jgi:O-methyltransferase involved in polyketide biosynthesis
MSEIDGQDLSDVAETLLITLYLRAMESQRPDALIKDEKAVALVTQMSYDFGLGQTDPAQHRTVGSADQSP